MLIRKEEGDRRRQRQRQRRRRAPPAVTTEMRGHADPVAPQGIHMRLV